MKMAHRRFLAAAVLSIVAIALPGSSAWPQTRTIKIVNPFPPGGTVDVLARVLAEQISRRERVTMVIENRPGAGGALGADAVARAAPDGNTLLLTAPGFIVNPHLRKLNYDPLTSFEPICNLVQSPQVIVVDSASPYRTFADLVNAARARPGELTMAGTGPATSTHIAFEVFKRAARLDMTFVPFPGNGPTVNALLGNHVTSAELNFADVGEHLKAGRMRALAAPMHARIEPLPELPTVTEFGYTDFEMNIWFGIVAPAKTPKETLDQLAGWFTSAMAVPDVRPKLVVQGLYPDGRCGAGFGAFLRQQYDDYGRAIREANIKAE